MIGELVNHHKKLEREIEHYKNQLIFSQKMSANKSERMQHFEELLTNAVCLLHSNENQFTKESYKDNIIACCDALIKLREERDELSKGGF